MLQASPLFARAPGHALRLAFLFALAVFGCNEGPLRNASDAGRSRDAGPSERDAQLPSAGADAGTPGDAAALEQDAGSDAAAPDQGLPEGPLAWESSTVTTDDGKIVIEKVSYLSDGLRVFGQVCRPSPGGDFGPGPYPVQIINHGGFSGIPAWNGGTCENNARKGWVAAESSYRGEDGSEGDIEVCLGEVTDVLRMTQIVLAQPYADPGRVIMSGGSHGGCITLRAVQRGAPVQMAVDIFGPTDWADAYRGWRKALDQGTLLAVNYQLLVTALEQATGGTPDTVPEEFARRSPLSYVPALDRAPVPVLVLQGVTDAYVPPAQSCALGAAGAGFQSFHVTTTGTVSQVAPAGCEGAGLTWQPGPRPSGAWPAERYLMVYEDVGHGFEGKGTQFLLADFLAFLLARFPP